MEIGFIHLTRCKLSCRFECLTDTDIAAVVTAGEHRTSGNDNARDIQSCSCHEHARDDFVAIRDEYQSIKAGCHGYGFDGIGNEFAACQRELHTCMPHGNTVADTNGRKFNRCAAACRNTELCHVGNLSKMDMSRYNFIE